MLESVTFKYSETWDLWELLVEEFLECLSTLLALHWDWFMDLYWEFDRWECLTGYLPDLASWETQFERGISWFLKTGSDVKVGFCLTYADIIIRRKDNLNKKKLF